MIDRGEMETRTDLLREKFHMIQEQQKKRFKMRTQNISDDGYDPKAFIPNKAHCEDLDLKTATQLEVPYCSHNSENPGEPVTEHKEANNCDLQFLQTQVQDIQLENVQLKLSLKQAEAKAIEINQIREEERQALGSTSATATQRIVELSKRNRELNAELASERNNVRRLQKKLKEATCKDRESDSKQSNISQSGHIVADKDDLASQENLQAVIEQLKEQLQVSNQKRAEHRNECQVLKQELKLLHKVITKEVGEGVNISSLLNGVHLSGWRGRSQQIIALQNKVSELQQKVVRLSGTAQKQSSEDSNSRASHVNVDSRQISALKKLEDTKKKSLEESRSELSLLQSEYSKLQHKCLALKSRNKTLTTELKLLKEQMGTPNGKHSHENSQDVLHSSQSSKDTLDTQERLVLEQRNQRLQTQLTKCLSELHSLKQASRNCQSDSNTRSPRSAPLPPVIPPPGSRSGKRPSISQKTASPRQSLATVTSRTSNTLSQVSQIENERLAELTFSLQQRLDSSTDKLLRTDSDLRTARQQIARLEQQLGKTPGRPRKYDSKEPRGHTLDMRELEMRLEIQKNENEVLKETLDQARHEKLTDMKLFQDMMKETKLLFVDSVKQLYTQQPRPYDS